MRLTRDSWWCINGHKNMGDSRSCHSCSQTLHERHAQVHASERTVVYYNPLTGEHRTPMRNDLEIPAKFAAQGFERKEILHMGSWEKETGLVHEATSWNAGNEVMENTPPAPTITPEVKEDLVNVMRDAMASGPWTGGQLQDAVSSVSLTPD